MKIFNKQKNNGFTLIEIMVATSIFMIIMLMAMGAIITSSNSAKKAQALLSAMDNVNFALEGMTRSLRTGSGYTCLSSASSASIATCNTTSGTQYIGFISADKTNGSNIDTIYYKGSSPDHANSLRRTKIVNGITSDVDLISTDVSIDDLMFYVKGNVSTDQIQPSVYIIMKGVATVKGVKDYSFAIQTMASQRSTK